MPLHNRIANISGRTKTTAIKSILSRTQRERERERERERGGGGGAGVSPRMSLITRRRTRALPILAAERRFRLADVYIGDKGKDR